jgi:O-antigen/teichoic acid export membrane protein
VLARLLVPADFGLVVLATMLIAFLEILSQLELSKFLIVGRDVDCSYYAPRGCLLWCAAV